MYRTHHNGFFRRPELLLVLAAALAVLPSSAHADNSSETKSWGVTGFVGAHGYSEKSRLGAGQDSSVASSILVGARIWQKLGQVASVEFEAPLGVSSSRDQLATLFVTIPRVQGRMRPFPGSKFSPSLVFGGGASIVTSNRQNSVLTDIQPILYVGAGIDVNLKRLRIGIETRYAAVRGIGDELMAHEWDVLLSFGLVPDKKTIVVVLPPSDRDRDGIPDDQDKCPERAEDLDGFKDEDGCPELDNDDDGVIDGLDMCQGEAETYNGFRDGDGCPDEISDDIRLMEGVISGLVFDAGSAVMEDDGRESLDKLVNLLKSNPSVKIELFGYSDDREAPPEELETISQERADSVRDFLIEAGVGYGRIRAVGRGASNPFADNQTASGRRFNRRVEVKIASEDPTDDPGPIQPSSEEVSEEVPLDEPTPDEANPDEPITEE